MASKVVFAEDASALISRLAKEERVSREEVLRRVLGLYDFLHEEGVVPGGKKNLQIRDVRTDEVEKEIVY